MKPRIYGSPYMILKDNKSRLTGAQYQAMKGQIRNGKADDAMRGLQRLLERRAKNEN